MSAGNNMSEGVDLYNNVYAHFSSRAEADVRHHAFGEDIGQSSWITAADWLRFSDQALVRADSHVLEVGSGSGGPPLYLAGPRGNFCGPSVVAGGRRDPAASISASDVRCRALERLDVPHFESSGGSHRM